MHTRAQHSRATFESVILLLGFALLAGAGTALSPCVLPVLPALLSATGAGGRRRPLGAVLGLSATFTITIVGVSAVVGGVGLGSDPLRILAVCVLAAFGLALLAPGVAARLEAPLAGLTRLAPRSRGDGFRSGLFVGAALGLVYTPCAGPILAAVITVGAATGRSIAVAIAYAIGSGIVLLAVCLGGRRVIARIRSAGGAATAQRAMGVVMLATAVAVATGVDVRFDQFVAQKIPNVDLTAGLERSHAVSARLASITGHKPRFAASAGAGAAAQGSRLPVLGTAPDFRQTERWFNTPGGRPETLASLRGRVVLVDFWTYTCINCLRTLPYLEAWDRRYRNDGLTIVGVHTPEFGFEHDAGNVQRAVQRLGIRYPVAQDNQMGTWNAYGNEYWPADYLIDTRGKVRYAAAGEGDYGRTEAAIRTLLAERGDMRLGAAAHPHDVVVPSRLTTPETYLGTARADGWLGGEPAAGRHTYQGATGTLPLNTFAFGGTWDVGGQPATAVRHATIDAEIQARRAYLVLSSAGGRPRTVQVLLDGHPVGRGQAGADAGPGGRVTVRGQRLYSLVSLPRDERHRLTLRLAPGVTGFAFTFG
jgi:cytochrome c biogenesis protein CcdA/thiol-disulfide isomerase/thioredoxin